MNNSAYLNFVSVGCALISLAAIIVYPYYPVVSIYLALGVLTVISVIPALLSSSFNREMRDLEILQDRREEANWRENDRLREKMDELSLGNEGKRK